MIQSVCPLTSRSIELDISMKVADLAAAWDKPACSLCRPRCGLCRTGKARRFRIRHAMVDEVLLRMMPGRG